ncbi:hypothetical protein [Marinobacter shengliensis]|uniref:hypothetical protein n=1 Tax=Marinobacter shengliensis TaxID=1389223 RepID=UPI001E5BF865|nr:hypothetical protein [Marinobacter shengliensis]MCD1631344.1 hypothetical protein [Marinobacter shengliensis]
MKISTVNRDAIAQIILDEMAAGSAGSPVIEFYEGTMPSSFGATITDTLLAAVTLTNTVGTISNGVITFDPISEDPSADASGDIGYAVARDRDGGQAAYFTVSANGTGDINFSSVAVVAGQPVGISSFTVSIGGA